VSVCGTGTLYVRLHHPRYLPFHSISHAKQLGYMMFFPDFRITPRASRLLRILASLAESFQLQYGIVERFFWKRIKLIYFQSGTCQYKPTTSGMEHETTVECSHTQL